MKNLFALFLILVLIVCGIGFTKTNFKNQNGKVTFVTDIQQDCPSWTHTVQSGGKSYITANLKHFNFLKSNLKNIQGFTLKLNDITENQFIKDYNVKIIKKEVVENKQVIYGYTNKFNNHIFVDNKMCNVQIVWDNTLTVGVPAILDSF